MMNITNNCNRHCHYLMENFNMCMDCWTEVKWVV